MSHSTPPLPDEYDPPTWAADAYAQLAKSNPQYLLGLRRQIDEVLAAQSAVTAPADASDVHLPEEWSAVSTEILLRLEGGELEVTQSRHLTVYAEDFLPADVVMCSEWNDWVLDQAEWVGPDLWRFSARIDSLRNAEQDRELLARAEQAVREHVAHIREFHLARLTGEEGRFSVTPRQSCCKESDEWVAAMLQAQEEAGK